MASLFREVAVVVVLRVVVLAGVKGGVAGGTVCYLDSLSKVVIGVG